MGYDPLEFLNAYNENLRNQSRDAVSFNALAEIVCNICQEDFNTEQTVEYTLPNLLAKVRAEAIEMGIEVDRHSTKFAWAKAPNSLSEELMSLSSLIEDSYGYRVKRYRDNTGKNGRKKGNSVIEITDLNVEPEAQNKSDKGHDDTTTSNP